MTQRTNPHLIHLDEVLNSLKTLAYSAGPNGNLSRHPTESLKLAHSIFQSESTTNELSMAASRSYE